MAAVAGVALGAWLAMPAPSAARRQSGGSSTFPVTIRVDASKPTGPLKPIWRFFGADEPNYAYMKDGQKLLADLGRLAPEARLLPRAQPARDRRRHAGAEVGIHQRLSRRRAGQSDLRLDDRRSHLRHLPGARREAVRADRLHARGAVDQAAALPARVDAAGEVRRDLHRLGVSAEGLQEVGRAGLRSGRSTASSSTGATKSSTWYWETWNEANIGYWRGTPEEFRKLHDYAIDGVRRALPTARVGGPDTAGHGGQFTRDFLEH